MPPDAPDARVFVVDDDEAVRQSLLFRLDAADFSATAFASAEQFLAAWRADWRGCLLTDVRLPGMDGLALIEEMSRRRSLLAVIVMTGFAEVAQAARAMRAGAVDFLEKPFEPGSAVTAVGRALARPVAAPFSAEAERVAELLSQLSRREREVFDGLVMGKLGKQVAIDLGISPRTVEIYRAHLMSKLGVSTLSDLIRMGLVAQLSKGGP